MCFDEWNMNVNGAIKAEIRLPSSQLFYLVYRDWDGPVEHFDGKIWGRNLLLQIGGHSDQDRVDLFTSLRLRLLILLG